MTSWNTVQVEMYKQIQGGHWGHVSAGSEEEQVAKGTNLTFDDDIGVCLPSFPVTHRLVPDQRGQLW